MAKSTNTVPWYDKSPPPFNVIWTYWHIRLSVDTQRITPFAALKTISDSAIVGPHIHNSFSVVVETHTNKSIKAYQI